MNAEKDYKNDLLTRGYNEVTLIKQEIKETVLIP
jgi:hypothetical protein